ncbi:hypothetical protein [Sphingosinicella humi]|uniref:Uncharacterized protein n=1 Tax=Allosphingosinicella humi TaxID=2068657 RepID=A0A2U2J2P4_9SPHN|nr:hypothetical protein [Sphingosinicella humi]PWG02616.1 hypothetical protein DF286_06850 [Sphingosinicella humi]
MLLIGIGALLVVAGVVLATVRNARRGGRMSEAETPVTHQPRDTLEPTGQGDRLSFKPDLPGIGLIVLGLILMAIGAG